VGQGETKATPTSASNIQVGRPIWRAGSCCLLTGDRVGMVGGRQSWSYGWR